MSEKLLQRKAQLEEFLRSRPRSLSSLSFVNLFLWQDFFDFEFVELDGNLGVFATSDPGTFLYFPPLGKKISAVATRQFFRKMREQNRSRGVARLENVPAEELDSFPESEYVFYHKGYEYLYYRRELAGLQGQDYKSKRHDCHLFERHHAAQFLPFIPDMKSSCVALYDRWAADRRAAYPDAVYQQMLDDNRTVHALGMRFAAELGLIGRVVVIDGKIGAYTFGYELTPEIFCVLFEVADLRYTGLPAYIFTRFCRDEEIERYKFINVMDDFGVKNLEQVKMSFRPSALIAAHTVNLRDEK